jgi:hypothetical protein
MIGTEIRGKESLQKRTKDNKKVWKLKWWTVVLKVQLGIVHRIAGETLTTEQTL